MTFKQVPPNLVLNKTVVTKVNSLAIQSDQKAIAAGKQKNSLLKAKVNQSTTMLNGQLLVTGANILARSHHFSNQSKTAKSDVIAQDDKAENVSERSVDEEDLVEGNCEPAMENMEANEIKEDVNLDKADMQEVDNDEFEILDKAEMLQVEET